MVINTFTINSFGIGISQDFESTKVFGSKKNDGSWDVTYSKNNFIYLLTDYSDTLIYGNSKDKINKICI